MEEEEEDHSRVGFCKASLGESFYIVSGALNDRFK
jgi:hypothetical protein